MKCRHDETASCDWENKYGGKADTADCTLCMLNSLSGYASKFSIMLIHVGAQDLTMPFIKELNDFYHMLQIISNLKKNEFPDQFKMEQELAKQMGGMSGMMMTPEQLQEKFNEWLKKGDRFVA